MTTKKAVKAAVVSRPGVGSIVAAPTGAGESGAQSGAAPVVAPKGFRAKLQQMLLGWQAVIPKGASLTVAGGPLTQATVVTELQSYLGAYSALDAAELGAKGARATVVQQATDAQAFYVQLKEALTGFFGSGSPELAQFGLKPRAKRQPLPVEKKAAMVAQMLGTRKLRGVMGKRQKAAAPKAGPVTVTYAPAPDGSDAAAQSQPAAPAEAQSTGSDAAEAPAAPAGK